MPIIIANLALGGWTIGWAVYALYNDNRHYRGQIRVARMAIDTINIVMVSGCVGIRLYRLKSLGLIGKWAVVGTVSDILSAWFGVPWSIANSTASACNISF